MRLWSAIPILGLLPAHGVAPPPCTASQYATGDVCAPLTTCTASQFELSPPTLVYTEPSRPSALTWAGAVRPRAGALPWAGGARIVSTSDRVCRALSTCSATQWETKAAGAHHDRACAEHTKCGGATREAWHAGTHHDRECAAGQVCSHVTCAHEAHNCPTHRAYKARHAFVQHNTPCDGPATQLKPLGMLPWAGAADGRLPLPIASIRVRHHGAETTCRRGAHCKLHRGDDGGDGGGGLACVCTQRFPTRPDAASCQLPGGAGATLLPLAYRAKAACFRHCRATGEAAACAAAVGFVDTQPPVLTRCGARTEFVNRWSNWQLCRLTAVDGIDGDVSGAIRYDVRGPRADNGRAESLLANAELEQVVRLLDRRHVGRYDLTARVCDQADNCATAHQRIVVREVTSRLSCRHLPSFEDAVGGDGSVCSASFCGYLVGRVGGDTTAGEAGKRKTFAYAREHCRQQGARLCTFREVQQLPPAACEHTDEHVWTSSFSGCDRGAHVVAIAGHARVCKGDSESFAALRCCADRRGHAHFFVGYKGWNIVPQAGAAHA